MKTEFYYTGASALNEEQTVANASIGGYISSSRVIMNATNNLFSAESYKSIAEQREQYRCIAMKATENLYDVSLKVLIEDEDKKNFTLELGLNAPSSKGTFEMLSDDKIEPSYTEFESTKYGTSAKAFEMGDIVKDTHVGVWLKRQFNDVYNDLESLTNKLCANSDDLKVHNKDTYSIVKFEVSYNVGVTATNSNNSTDVAELSEIQFPCNVTGFAGHDLGDANSLQDIVDFWNNDIDSAAVGELSVSDDGSTFVMDFVSLEAYDTFTLITLDFTPV